MILVFDKHAPKGKALLRTTSVRGTKMRDELVMRIPGIQACPCCHRLVNMASWGNPCPLSRGSRHLLHIPSHVASGLHLSFLSSSTKALIKYFYYMLTHNLSTCVYINTVVLNSILQWTLQDCIGKCQIIAMKNKVVRFFPRMTDLNINSFTHLKWESLQS